MTFNKWKLWSVFENLWTNISKAMNNLNQALWVLSNRQKIRKFRSEVIWKGPFLFGPPDLGVPFWQVAWFSWLFYFFSSVDFRWCRGLQWGKDFSQFTRFYLKMTYPFSFLIPVASDRLAWHDINNEYPVKPKSAWKMAFGKLRERLLARSFGEKLENQLKDVKDQSKGFISRAWVLSLRKAHLFGWGAATESWFSVAFVARLWPRYPTQTSEPSRRLVISYLSTLFLHRWYMTPSTVNAYYSPSRNQIGTFSPRVDS